MGHAGGSTSALITLESLSSQKTPLPIFRSKFLRGGKMQPEVNIDVPSQSTAHEHAGKNTFLLRVEKWHVRIAIFRYRFRRRAAPIRVPMLRLRRRVYRVWLELRSCWFRIGKIRGTTRDASLGPWAEMDATGHLVVCKRTSGRIQGIRYVLATHPWASPEDQRLFLQGWEIGAEWVLHENGIPHTCSRDTAQQALGNPPLVNTDIVSNSPGFVKYIRA